MDTVTFALVLTLLASLALLFIGFRMILVYRVRIRNLEVENAVLEDKLARADARAADKCYISEYFLRQRHKDLERELEEVIAQCWHRGGDTY